MDFDEYEYLEKEVENLDEKSKKAVNGGDDNVKSRGKERSSRSSKHRGRDDDSKDHRDKKSKTGEDSRDSDRRGEKGSSRHRSRSREGDRSERDRDRHSGGKDYRDEKNGKERGGRDSERDRDGDRRNRDRDRTKGREHQHDREQRSRSHSERHGDDGEKPQERNYKERDVVGGDRKNRHHKEKKEDGTEPEADPERDQRTVFAYQIALKAHERDVYEFFSRAGKVRDVQLIMDRNSRRSKGFGYIEFYDVMSVPMAIALSGQPLLGHPVMVKPSEAEKNLVQPTSTAAGAAGASDPYTGRKLYVGNLHYNISEEQLRQVFESFGSVDLVQLPLDETGHCKGFGFVQFARLEDAKAAQTLNGQLEIAGRVIKVSAVTDQTSGTQDAMKSTGELDDDEGGGLSLNAHSRALLMAKLDRTGAASSINSLGTGIVNGSGFSTASAPIHGVQPVVSSLPAPLLQASVSTFGGSVPTVTVPSINSIGIPSECLMLNNMFDPTLEAEPDFDLDIKEDVQEECSKFGSLKHISVDKNSAGHVYLRFDTTQAAVSAQRALNGRWFAGKMITAIFMVPQNYEAKFPESV